MQKIEIKPDSKLKYIVTANSDEEENLGDMKITLTDFLRGVFLGWLLGFMIGLLLFGG